jgi:uncharacterized protein with NRDE domain
VCTLIALHRRISGAPLVIAANRDEYLDRPSEGPALRETPHGMVVAPRDLRAGGTWLGLNGSGVFAALTNRPTADPDRERRSRGLLVMDALRGGRATDSVKLLESESLADGRYNPFNLLVADSESCFLFTYEETPQCIELGPGTHVIGNVDPAAEATPKLEAISERARQLESTNGDNLLDGLADICRTHTGSENALDGTCVHAGPYGTRSSFLLRLGDDENDRVLRYADGAPCHTQYDDYTPILHDLRRPPGYDEGGSAMRSAS